MKIFLICTVAVRLKEILTATEIERKKYTGTR